MTRNFWMAAGVALMLASCGREASSHREYASAPAPAPTAVMAMDAAPKQAMARAQSESFAGAPAKPEIAPNDPSGSSPTDNRQIAYTYTRTLRAPTTRMQDLMNAHKAACEAAGPTNCYVSNSSISGLGTEDTYGSLELHAAPGWMKTFLEGLPESLKPFDSTVDASNTSSEDLTVQIVDTSARLNSSKMLRERLNALLKDRPGKLSDLLDIERELARVQAEIDATESVIAALKARVSMSTLTLSYQPKASAISRSIWQPLGNAFDSFLPNLVESLAGVVNFISSMLLWIVLLAGIVWGGLALLRRRRQAKNAQNGAKSPPPPPPTPLGPRPVSS